MCLRPVYTLTRYYLSDVTGLLTFSVPLDKCSLLDLLVQVKFILHEIFLKTAEVFTKYGEKRMLWLFFIHFFFIFYFLLEFKVKKYLKKFSQVHQWKIYRIYIKRITFTLMNQCCINYSSLREGNLSLLISRCTFSIPLLFVWDKTQ